MFQKTKQKQEWALASYRMADAMSDFILSRQAMLCTPQTVEWYMGRLGAFVKWLEGNGVLEPEQINARTVRQYLAELKGRGLADGYVHGNARCIRTLLRFFYAENYITRKVKFVMPKVLVFTSVEVKRLVKACTNVRDVAIVLFLVDTGVRRKELCDLNWEDVDLKTGLISIMQGKGKKYRATVTGVKTRRALLKYRRTISHEEDSPLFQTRDGKRFKPGGMRSCLNRIGDRAGMRVNAHALRRTFATLSLRGGMDIAALSRLMGHSEISTTMLYIELLDHDLIVAHSKASPVDKMSI